MGRYRKKDDAWIGLVARLGGAILLFSLLSPEVRNFLVTIAFISKCVMAVVIVLLFGFIFYRSYRSSHVSGISLKSQSLPGTSSNVPVTETPRSQHPSVKQDGPSTTTEILQQLRSIDWFQFEMLVGLLYRKLGYTVTRRGGANPDGGIDLVIEKDGQRSAIQCKQWKTWNVGVKAVREFLGALTDAGIQKGIFITLCGYTGEARQLAEKHGIEIFGEEQLSCLLDANDARFDPELLAILRDTRKYCPKCESEMVLRTASKGPGSGKQFWGCSTYPRCRFTMNIE